MIAYPQQTLASLVSKNHRTAPVLEKYKLDFCCKGKRTLEDACIDNNISIDEVIAELEQVSNISLKQLRFEEMTAEQLIQYIILNHHFYVKQALPNILGHIQKIATKHGDRFPFMIEVYNKFCQVYEEMFAHMEKEEQILFPRIKEIEQALAENGTTHLKEYIAAPIELMEHEHESAGRLMQEINELTNGYTAPEAACTTFRITLDELKEFEEDLHKHVHLENYILFPKAEKLFS